MSKKVSIEVGHGGSDFGAIKGNIYEKDINLSVARHLKSHLERNGITVLMSREKDVDDRAKDFYPKAQEFKPDIGISVHTNAFNGIVKGFEIFRNTNSFKNQSNTLCAAIEAEVRTLGQTSRGIKNSGFLMSGLQGPTAYCELGFLDNPADYAQFDNPSKRNKFAEAYAKGIVKYLGLKWVELGKNSAPSTEPGPAPAGKTIFRVQVGAFSVKTNAENYKKELLSKDYEGFIAEVDVSGVKIYRVQVGAFSVKSNAENYAEEFRKLGYKCFIVEAKL